MLHNQDLIPCLFPAEVLAVSGPWPPGGLEAGPPGGPHSATGEEGRGGGSEYGPQRRLEPLGALTQLQERKIGEEVGSKGPQGTPALKGELKCQKKTIFLFWGIL